MLRYTCKNTINNSQDSMLPIDPSNPNSSSEKHSMTKAQKEGFKKAVVNMHMDLKERNKSYNEINENMNNGMK